MVDSIRFLSFSPGNNVPSSIGQKVESSRSSNPESNIVINHPASASPEKGDLWIEQQAALLRHFYVSTGQVAFTIGSGFSISEDMETGSGNSDEPELAVQVDIGNDETP